MTIYNYQLVQPNQQLIFDQATGDLVGLKNPHANGADLNLNASSGSAIIGFIQFGTGAVARTAQDKMREHVSTPDYSSVSVAVTAVDTAGNGTLEVPNNISITVPATFLDVVFDYKSKTAMNVYNLSETGRSARRMLQSQETTHTGTEQISVLGIEHRPAGSGANGPSNADIGETISVIKQDWANTSVQGEIDGLNIAIRQGGAAGGTASDAGGLLIDASTVTGSGWLGAIESTTRTVQAATGTTLKSVRTQVGVIDSVTNVAVGLYASSETGALDDGLRIDINGGTWTNYLHFIKSGVSVFKVDANGQLVLTATSGATPKKTIRVNSGALTVVNDAGTIQILSLADDGSLSLNGGLSAVAEITGPTFHATGSAAATTAGQLTLGSSTSTTATAGAQTLPANPLGFLNGFIGATAIRIPYYAA